jgi:YidC/Oxa1 family membrane protein insertase
MKLMMWVLGPVSLLFTLWLPSGVTFYFAFAALLGLLQNTITMQPWFRRWAKLPLLQPPPVDPSAYQPPKGASAFTIVREQFKQTLNDAQSGQGGMIQRMQAKAEHEKEEKAKERKQESVRTDMWKRMDKKRR